MVKHRPLSRGWQQSGISKPDTSEAYPGSVKGASWWYFTAGEANSGRYSARAGEIGDNSVLEGFDTAWSDDIIFPIE